MGIKVYGYNRVAFTMTMLDNGVVTTAGGFGQSNGVWGVTDPADGIMDIRDMCWGGVLVPTGWVTADLTFTAATTRAGTYSLVYTASGSIARSVVASSTVPLWIAIPTAAFQCGPYLKIASTNTASAADVSQTGGPLVFNVLVGA